MTFLINAAYRRGEGKLYTKHFWALNEVITIIAFTELRQYKRMLYPAL